MPGKANIKSGALLMPRFLYLVMDKPYAFVELSTAV